MKIRKLSLVALSVLLAFTLCAFVACNGNGGDGTYTPGDEAGNYYCVVGGSELNLAIEKDGKVTLKLDDEELIGSCSLNEAKKLVAVFGDSVDMIADISYSNDVITFQFRTKEYRFLRDVNYTVKFDAKGGSAVPDATVRNGKTLAKPADPVLAGSSFVGWYKDEACTEPYQFGSEAVTKNMTLYALYSTMSDEEFNVTYNPNYEGATITTAKTQNGTASTEAPTRDGYVFLGWYVSAYEDASKLTYKYDGGKLYQNTVLFAVWKSKDGTPAVSVTSNKIAWSNEGIGSYTIYVRDKAGDVVDSETVAGAYELTFDFASLSSGEYVIEVTYRGKSGYSYYKNKALDKVSLFKVVNGTALTFNTVPDAEEYFITIDCGNKAHKHTNISNGASATYNFANCEMQQGGIKFTVTATKKGYMSSVSDTFVFEQGLNAVSGLSVVSDDGKATWTAVDNATSYKVDVTYGGSTETYYVSDPEISLKNYGAGSVIVSVTPLASNYYSPEATSITYEKTTLASPVNVRLDDKTLTWDAVSGATSYTVLIGEKTYETATNSLELQESYFTGNDWTVAVKVKVGNAESLYCDSVSVSSVGKLTQDMVYYKDGKVYWGNVFGAKTYRVTVDNQGGKIVNASEPHEFSLDFTTAGEHTVKIMPFGISAIQTDPATIKVQIYEIAFNANDGKEVSSMFVAQGDYLNLPETVKGGYDFIGWYNSVDGAVSGKKYNDGEFSLNYGVTVYAGWNPKKFAVNMTWSNDGKEESMQDSVSYMTDYQLPVPENDDKTQAFYGWYSGSIRYTDENGNSLRAYDVISEITLSARFVEVLKFELNKNLQEGETEKSYYVEKGEYISLVSEITIPETYNGKRVTVINGGAFASANKLKKINIPDTVKYIFIGIEGINATGSAFQSCSSLAEINIYETESLAGEKGAYWSKDGIMYVTNSSTGQKEMFAVPYAKTGAVAIEDGIQTVPQGIFASSKVSSVEIPSSVTTIEKNAFRSNSNLTSIVFDEPEEGEEAQTLTIADEAFYILSNLLEITFPSRLKEFNNCMFRSCSKLANVYFAGKNDKYVSVDGVVMQANEGEATYTLVYYPAGREGAYEVDTSVTAIGESAFSAKFKKDDFTEENQNYTFYGSTKITKIVIPGSVTYIGKYAFRGCSKIESVEFKGGLKDLTIDEQAFYGLTSENFTTLTLPENLKTLGANAFGYCTKLLTVNLNSKDCSRFATGAFVTDKNYATPTYYVTTINIGKDTSAVEIAGVFGNKVEVVNVHKDNKNYTVNDNVVYDYDVTAVLFYPVEKAGEYVTPDTLKTIGANVFRGREKLTKVTIKKGVTSIGTGAFFGCKGLTEVIFEGDRTEDLTLGDEVFRNCSALVSASLPEKTVSVGYGLFYYCGKLERVDLPSTLESIADGYDTTIKKDVFNMFYGNTSYALESVNVATGNRHYASIDGVLYKIEEGNPVALLFCPSAKTGTVDVPKTVTEISAKAFYGANATELTFSNGIKEGATLTLGDQAFGNSKLQKVQLPEGLTEIPDKMFYYCQTLVNVTIPSTVTRIGKEAFYYCTSLEYVNVPKMVTLIDEKAFYNCKVLKEIAFEQESEKFEDGTYKYPLVIADGSASSGGSTGGVDNTGVFSKTAVTELIFPDRTQKIGSYLMGYTESHSGSGTTITRNTTLKKVVIPSTIEYIGKYAFQGCLVLETVEFKGDGVSKLTDTKASEGALYYVFTRCPALKSINLPETSAENGYSLVNTFYEYYAERDSALTSIVIPKTVSAMKNVFSNNSNLQNVSFKEGSMLKTLEQSFSNCLSLSTITLPDGLETIGSKAFQTTGLTSIVIPKTVSKISYSAFEGLTGLTEVKFDTYKDGDNAGKCDLTSIDYQAFKNTGLTSFEFPVSTADSIALGKGTTVATTMGRLFAGCKNLTEVTISKSVTDIEYVFKDALALTTVNIAKDNTSFATVSGKPYIYSYDKTKENHIGSAILFVFGTLTVDKDGVFTLDSGITEIAAYAFEGQNSIKSVTIPYTVQKVGTGAFTNCLNLKKVVFENSAEKPSALKGDELGQSIFSGCTSLDEVILPDSANMTIIPKEMFKGSAIKSIKIPSNVITISESAFANCTSLTAVEFAEDGNLTTIGTKAFNMCDLREISFPHSLEKIDTYCFLGNVNLSSVIFLTNNEGKTSIKTINGAVFGYSSSTYGSPCVSLKSIVIPASVETIGPNVFANTGLESITFEEGSALTSIGSTAFMNTAISSIAIPSGVKKLDTSVFEGCSNLTTLTIPEDSAISELGKKFITGTAITEFKVPSGVTKLVDATFQDATSLEKIILPEGLATIGGYVFYNCANLVSIDIPDTVTKFGNYCFTGCINLKNVNFGADSALTAFGTYMFSSFKGNSSYPAADACVSLETFAVPDGVKELSTHLFDGCTALRSVTFGDSSSLIYLSTYTFANSGLKSIEVPAGVTMIGASKTSCTTTASSYTFYNCENLTDVTFKGQLAKIGGHVFENCTSLKLDIPSTVSLIGEMAFANTGMETVTVPKKLTSASNLGKGAFAYNKKLAEIKTDSTAFVIDPDTGALLTKAKKLVCVPAGKEIKNGTVVIPEGVTVGEYAFAGCDSVTSITLPANITTLANYAFAGATGLKSITIPKGVTKLGTSYSMSYLFDGCTSLEKVTILGQITLIGGYTFRNCTSLTSFEIPESVTQIGYCAFNGSGLTELTIPETVKTFNSGSSYSIFGNSALEKVTLNNATTATYLFLGCENLTEVNIGKDITTLSANMFQDCTALESITIPDTVTTLGNYLFQGCSSLKNVKIGSGIEALGNYMFQDCTSLKTIVLPDTVTKLGTNLFKGCTELTSVTFGKDVTEISANMFMGCTSLTEYVVPETITTIGNNAFQDCTSLKEVTLPTGLTTLGSNAFRGCTALEKVNNLELLTEIKFGTFYNCTSLKEVNLQNATKFGYEIFVNCTALKKIVFPNVPTAFGRDNFNGWTGDQEICFAFSQGEATVFGATWNNDCFAKVTWDYQPA